MHETFKFYSILLNYLKIYLTIIYILWIKISKSVITKIEKNTKFTSILQINEHVIHDWD